MKKQAWVTTVVFCSLVLGLVFVVISSIDDGCFLFSCSSLNIPVKGSEASAVGADYTKLDHLLSLGKFEQADLETAEKILTVMRRKADGQIYINDLEKFPCKDLGTINNLWLGYSGGKFGITVQRKLYQKILKDLSSQPRKTLKPNEDIETKVFDRFAESIGWKVKGKSLSENELPVNQNGGEGYLPRSYMKLEGCNGIRFSLCLLGYPWYGGAPDLSQQFFSRTTSCKL